MFAPLVAKPGSKEAPAPRKTAPRSPVRLPPGAFVPMSGRRPSLWCLPLQSKLKVGAHDDRLEREADRLADHALSELAGPDASAAPLSIRRTSNKPAAVPAAALPASMDKVLAAPGTALAPALKQEMESRFGEDFSHVRLHTDAAAQESARRLNANAYTVGDRIAFASGQFAPETKQGRRLIAHELAHVVQQSKAHAIPQVQRQASSLPPILGAAVGMDNQGETILGTYLYGGGEPHDIDDPIWAAYMMRHDALRRQIFGHLYPAVQEIADRRQKERHPIVERFHAEFPENRDRSGYALLHGSNAQVGDFQLLGWAEVEEAVDPADGAYDIELELRFVFNDIVDPNKSYASDRRGSVFADIISFGRARSYRLSISWGSSCLAEVRGGRVVALSGYPSDRPRGVRPLPRAKLDLASANRKWAKEVEAEIVRELRRNIRTEDIAGLAMRKQKLLGMFYRLGWSYMGNTYLERFANPARDDDLPRLFQSRISGGLRTELMDALRGHRPHGHE